MADPRLLRLRLVHQKLAEVVKETAELVSISEEELAKKCKLIERYITTLTEEVHQYLTAQTHSPSLEEIEKCTLTQLKAEEVLANLKTLQESSMAESNKARSAENTAKLPKLTLPKFSGDILRWSEFWDRFETNIDSKPLPGADKLAYLLGCLEGEAFQAVEGLSVTHANYSVALDILKERYGDKRKVLDAHYDAIHSLPKAQDHKMDCRNNFNTIERHLRTLRALGEQTDGNHLRSAILSKFPDKTVYELHLLSCTESVEKIREGLQRVISAMESTGGETTQPTPSTSQQVTTGALHVSVKHRRSPRENERSGRSHKVLLAKSTARTAFQRKRKAESSSDRKGKRPKIACVFCGGDHFNAACDAVKGVEERKRRLGRKCYLCFKEGHRMTSCTYKKLCYYCKEKHNQALCPTRAPGNQVTTFSSFRGQDEEIDHHSYLQTAIATVGRPGESKVKRCRVLLDSGSQRSYVTERLAKEIGLELVKEDLLMIYVFGADHPMEISSPSATLEIETRRGITKTVQVNVVPYIAGNVIPPLHIDGVDVVADDGSAGQDIQLLIGNDYYFSFFRNEMKQLRSNLYLVDSDFGWMITGKNSEQKSDILSVITYCRHQEGTYLTDPDLPLQGTDIKFLWALESIGISDSPKVTREEEAVRHFNETVQYQNHRYQVKWPWISYPPDLPTNYGLAHGRLSSLIRRLTPEMKREYDEILKGQLKAGIIEAVEPSDANSSEQSPVHYLPHHVVVQEGKKYRIVYDASAKLRDSKSLNECMYRGPLMLEDLTALLLKFRLNKIGITADIEKAFLQVGLQLEDRDVTRFLWLKDVTQGVSEENTLHLRFCRVPFGIIASSFLLTATIRHHLSKGDGSLIKEIAEKTYVDNLVTGAGSLQEARDLVNKARSAFSELSMNIRDWISNDNRLMKNIPKQLRSKDSDQTKVLGLTWHVKRDSLTLKLDGGLSKQNNRDVKSKREVLRTLASVYDPCGFAAPLTLPAKLLLQELWKRKLKWDTTLPEELEGEWRDAQSLLEAAKEIEVPRYVGDTSRENTSCELHCFTDASKRAFAAVVYLRLVNRKGSSPKTVFLMAKSRVTPIAHKEDLKIPKLELLGFVIGKRLLAYVKETLGLEIERTCLWTDSEIILHWMKSEKLLPPFVARRIDEVKQMKEIEAKYVRSESNPADLATRPEKWHIKKEMWTNGPHFLSLREEDWPRLRDHGQATSCATLELENDDVEMGDVIEVEEELAGQSEATETETEKSSENGQTETERISSLQKMYFPEEMSGQRTSLARNLGLFTDQDGLLRCKGRIMNSACPYNMKHPILIPKNSEFTDNLIRETHENHYHVGPPHTLSIIRQKYWIPQGKAKVQRIIKKCQQCVKHGGGPFKLPPTPALPPERANYSAPFTYTGIDYFGPLFINDNGQQQKRWICLYTCLAVRAVHLEVVRDLTAEECLLAMRRFISTQGRPELIISDNALQFKLTAEVMAETQFSGERIRWKFIPQLSPWHGAFYERLIGIVKNCLKRTIGKQLLTDTQLSTIVKEVEAITNSRPLTCVGSDIEYVLKPSDFLTLGKHIYIEPSIQDQKPGGTVTRENLVQGWKKGLRILEEYKKMFHNQYLCSLRERYRHSPKEPRVTAKRDPQVGDVVQIKGDSKNRENWQVGKISSLVKIADGECRVAKVEVNGKEFVRSVGHLYPLEVEKDAPRTNTEEPQIINLYEPETETMGQVGGGEETSQEEVTTPREMVPLDLDPEASRTSAGEARTETTGDGGDHFPREEMEVDAGSEEARPTEAGERVKRLAAIRAREKIALWTDQLTALLLE